MNGTMSKWVVMIVGLDVATAVRGGERVIMIIVESENAKVASEEGLLCIDFM